MGKVEAHRKPHEGKWCYMVILEVKVTWIKVEGEFQVEIKVDYSY